MTKTWQSTPVKLLAELAVVFLGVLIALAADSWWNSLEDRRRETAYLGAISSDMSDAIEELSGAIDEDSTYQADADRRLRVLRGRALGDGQDIADFLEFYAADLSVPLGTLRALLTTSDLSLVRAENLRSTLIREAATLDSELTWVEEVTGQAAENIQDMLVAGEGLEIRARASGRAVSLDDLRNDREIVGGTAIYVTQMANILSSLHQARSAATRIQAVVDSELAAR